jgi:quercetin dioxygenase-like cupin family protein
MLPPPGFEVRAVEVEPGGARIYHETEWQDALVLLARGTIELECRGGSRHGLRPGDVFWLVGLPVRVLRNGGTEPAILLAVSRRHGNVRVDR